VIIICYLGDYLRFLKVVLIIFLIILTSFLSGCFNDEKKDSDNDSDNNSNLALEYSFEIEISTINSKFFYLYTPLPLFGENEPIFSPNDTIAQQIIENIVLIMGKGNYEIITTEYGKALNISSNKNITLISQGELNWQDQFSSKIAPLYLSMMNDNNIPEGVLVSEKYWIFSNNTNISLKIKLDTKKLRNKIPRGHTNFNSDIIKLKKGWQIIDIEESIKVP